MNGHATGEGMNDDTNTNVWDLLENIKLSSNDKSLYSALIVGIQ